MLSSWRSIMQTRQHRLSFVHMFAGAAVAVWEGATHALSLPSVYTGRDRSSRTDRMRERAREHPEQAGRERAARTAPHYGLRALGETVSAAAGPMLGCRGFAGSRVVAEWASIVGEALAARSLPERVARAPGGHGGGTLHVRIASGALAVELQHLEPLIVERINTYFGYQAVARLKLVHGPIPERRTDRVPPTILTPADEATIEGLAAGIKDPTLRQALRDLGKRLFARDHVGE
jgi:hypothetical protein